MLGWSDADSLRDELKMVKVALFGIQTSTARPFDWRASDVLNGLGIPTDYYTRETTLTDGLLAGYDVLVINKLGRRVLAPGELASVKAFVAQGKGLIVTCDTNYYYSPPHGLDFTEEFGFRFGGDYPGYTVKPAPGYENHPIWHGVDHLTGIWDGLIAYAGPGVAVIGVTTGGSSAVVETSYERGKIVGLGTDAFYSLISGPDPDVFLRNLIYYVAPSEKARNVLLGALVGAIAGGGTSYIVTGKGDVTLGGATLGGLVGALLVYLLDPPEGEGMSSEGRYSILWESLNPESEW